jgi:aminoglycoside phosphotransferase (APT) family kinase protein
MSLDPGVVEWGATVIGAGAQVLEVEEMPDGSTQQYTITYATRNGIVRAVSRRYHDRERLTTDFAYAPGNEAAALSLLGSTQIPAPRLLAADLDGVVSGVPLLLETFVAGRAAWEQAADEVYLRAAAETLVQIHAIGLPAPSPVMAYRPYRVPEAPVERDGARGDLWVRVFEVLRGPSPTTPQGFIHRDYHPGNVLWDGSAVAVVDWTTAATGPLGIDLARMRQNLAGRHGVALADRFARLYVDAGGDPDARHPYWDLLDAADMMTAQPPTPSDEGDTLRGEDYVRAVLAELG